MASENLGVEIQTFYLVGSGGVRSEVIILRLANFCLPTRGNLNMTIVRFAVVIGRKAEVPTVLAFVRDGAFGNNTETR